MLQCDTAESVPRPDDVCDSDRFGVVDRGVLLGIARQGGNVRFFPVLRASDPHAGSPGASEVPGIDGDGDFWFAGRQRRRSGQSRRSGLDGLCGMTGVRVDPDRPQCQPFVEIAFGRFGPRVSGKSRVSREAECRRESYDKDSERKTEFGITVHGGRDKEGESVRGAEYKPSLNRYHTHAARPVFHEPPSLYPGIQPTRSRPATVGKTVAAVQPVTAVHTASPIRAHRHLSRDGSVSEPEAQVGASFCGQTFTGKSLQTKWPSAVPSEGGPPGCTVEFQINTEWQNLLAREIMSQVSTGKHIVDKMCVQIDFAAYPVHPPKPSFHKIHFACELFL